MTDRQRPWADRVQEWLDSLDPPLRTAAEAVVEEYLHPQHYEPIGRSVDWLPESGVRYEITVHFSSQEVRDLSQGLGKQVNPIQLMKDLLLEHARLALAERQDADPEAAVAAD